MAITRYVTRSHRQCFMCIFLKPMFSSPADDWIVIAKQHCVCALKELGDQHLEHGLDPPQCMQVVKVNLLKTETSWATRVSIAGRKQAIDLDISAVPPSEAADNFLMHLRDSPAGPEENAREHIHGTIPKASSGSAWILAQVSDDELQVCSIVQCEASQSEYGWSSSSFRDLFSQGVWTFLHLG